MPASVDAVPNSGVVESVYHESDLDELLAGNPHLPVTISLPPYEPIFLIIRSEVMPEVSMLENDDPDVPTEIVLYTALLCALEENPKPTNPSGRFGVITVTLIPPWTMPQEPTVPHM